jgi:hypothetical protein
MAAGSEGNFYYKSSAAFCHANSDIGKKLDGLVPPLPGNDGIVAMSSAYTFCQPSMWSSSLVAALCVRIIGKSGDPIRQQNPRQSRILATSPPGDRNNRGA